MTSSDTGSLLIQLAEKLGCPVTTTIMGLGAFPPEHPLALDVLGMHGAKYANVAIIDGDGSLNMTIHELSTCHRYGVGVKVVIINNQWLGMVRQWQDMIYKGRRADSSLGDPTTAVKRTEEVDIYPDFLAIAQGYRVTAERVSCKEDLRAAYERMLTDPDEPYLLDSIVRPEENVYPMIPAGRDL